MVAMMLRRRKRWKVEGLVFTVRYLRLVIYGSVSIDTEVKTVISSLLSGGKYCARLEP